MSLLALMLLGVSAQRSGRDQSRSHIVRFSALKPDLKLYVYEKYSLKPQDAGLRLVISGASGSSVIVTSPASFKRKVVISDSKRALEYVRLLRAPGLWHFTFRDPLVEVVEIPKTVFAPAICYRWPLKRFRDGIDGMVSAREWGRLGLNPPKVDKAGDSWHIKRTCLTLVNREYMYEDLDETVGRDGAYTFSTSRRRPASRHIRWNIDFPADE